MNTIYCVYANYGTCVEETHFYDCQKAKEYFGECIEYICQLLDESICSHPDWDGKDDDGNPVDICTKKGAFSYKDVSVYLEQWDIQGGQSGHEIYRVRMDGEKLQFKYFTSKEDAILFFTKAIRAAGWNGRDIDDCVQYGYTQNMYDVYLECLAVE